MSINPLNDISRVYLEQVATQEVEMDEGMSLKDFKANRRKLKRRESSADAKKRGHVGKEWYNSGRTYSPDEAKRGRAKLDDAERSTRHRSALDPEGDDRNYSADKTKNPKKLRKQKAMGELGESAVPGKPAERLGAVTAIPKAEQEAAKERLLAKAKAKREAMKTEALDPVGHEDADVDNDGKKNTSSDKYLLKRRKAIGKAISTQEAKEVKRWWDDDGDGKGYEEGEVSGKFKKKKSVKEGFSNWRQELSEVMTDTEETKKITEKKVNNKVKTSAMGSGIQIPEAVENLGGTLLEMVEIDEFDFILESAYDELLEEGYEEDDIEEALEYALTEAKVTFGHDTATKPEKKRSSLLAAARTKLSGAKTAAKAAVARGARKVAKGALGVARKMEGGSAAPKTAQRKPSTYRGAGAGQKERVSSGSYQAPTKKKAEKPADPWEGSATTPPKEKAKTKKAAAPKAAAPKSKAPAATKRKRKSKLDDLLASVRSESAQINEMPYQVMGSPDGKKEKKIGKPVKSRKYADARAAELADTHKATGGKYRSQYVEEVEQIDELSVNKMLAYKKKAEKNRDELNKKWDKGTATYREKMRVLGREEGEERASRRIQKKTGKHPHDMNKLDKLKAAVTKEETQIDEKTLSKMEMKKREEIVKSMKDKASDFEKRYPGRGKEVMYATATKMAKKMAEQALEMQPKSQSSQQKPDQQQKKMQQQQDRVKQQEIQILQRKLQALKSSPRGVDPSITA